MGTSIKFFRLFKSDLNTGVATLQGCIQDGSKLFHNGEAKVSGYISIHEFMSAAVNKSNGNSGEAVQR